MSVSRKLLCVLLLFSPILAGDATPAQAKGRTDRGLISIPLSALVVEEATATVSVLQDPLSPIKNVLKLCQSDGFKGKNPETDEFAKQIKTLCRAVDGLTHHIEAPHHMLQQRDFLVSVPLKLPQGKMKAVTWKSKTLDEAITFVDLLQGGKLKAVNAYSYYPPSSDPSVECSECPIKDLVFHAAKIRGQYGIFK